MKKCHDQYAEVIERITHELDGNLRYAEPEVMNDHLWDMFRQSICRDELDETTLFYRCLLYDSVRNIIAELGKLPCGTHITVSVIPPTPKQQ